ncbi:MAG TPA: hypothetical protein VKN63_02835 [Afifellaceae bacterium]|nr:hypothetical protein [Afifellaceae bacterium]
MLKASFRYALVPLIFAAAVPLGGQAATMSDENVCRYDKIVACSAVDGKEFGNWDLCEERQPFSVTAIAGGASQYAFEIVDEASGKTEYARGSNFQFGRYFDHGSALYTLGGTPENPLALVIRTPEGKPVTAETWTGSCTVKSVDVDMIEESSRGK